MATWIIQKVKVQRLLVGDFMFQDGRFMVG